MIIIDVDKSQFSISLLALMKQKLKVIFLLLKNI